MTNASGAANEQLLLLNHQIRELEHSLRLARKRKRWSNLSLAFGPFVLLILYITYWIPSVGGELITSIYIPGLPLALAFCVAAAWLKAYPGGVKHGLKESDRDSEGKIELNLSKIRDTRKLIIESAGFTTTVRRLTYKEDAFREIDGLREESTKYRRVNNILQGVLIVGSLAATGAAGVAGEIPQVRWAMMGLTFLVGISSGFLGYYKYKERSFYLQQTADSIEQEWEALEIGVGRYTDRNEEVALKLFSEEVHRLKSEQKKRQQNLEQPPELRTSEN